MRAMGQAATERIRRQEDEQAAATRTDRRAEQLLRLQMTAGNQAVAKLLRVSKDGAKRLKKSPGGVTLSTMTAFQKAGSLSDKDVDALLRLEDDELAEAVALDAKLFKGVEEETDVSARLRYAKTASAKPKTATVKPTQPRDLVIADVQSAGVLEPDARAFVNKVGVGEAKAWIAGKAGPVVAAAVRLCIADKGAATLQDVDTLIAHDAGLQNYGAAVVVPLAAAKGIQLVTEALTETRADHSVNYLECWLDLGATSASAQSFKDLIRLKGRLKDGVGGMAVYQADTQYMTAYDYPHSRTGFLRYPFGGGAYVELHTHWNVNVHKIVSIHVKEGGDKSTELNAWPSHFFGEVNAAVLAAHNAATGGLAPTGGALTL
jgi:hypothetical protein